jgi:hypothetical protein
VWALVRPIGPVIIRGPNREILFIMTRWRSRALILILVILAIASVSIRLGRTFVIRDMRGTPVPGAYVGYHYEGTTYALVEALSYAASPLKLLQSDAAGRVVVPGALHLHWPVIQSHPAVMINLIYAPTLHNGLASVRRQAVSRPSEFEVASDRATVRLDDVSSNPFLWQGTLWNLSSLLSDLTSHPFPDERTSTLTGQLVEHFIREYREILDRHGQTLRPRPTMPASVQAEYERQAWREMVDKDLTERPRWGDELKRRFAIEIARYEKNGARRQ